MNGSTEGGNAGMERLRYPIGRFRPRADLTAAKRESLIDDIAELPFALRAAVADLGPDQLDTRYRPGGWTVRQVVHHVPDSHMNAYARMKLAVTGDEPTITAYDEAAWAELADGREEDIEPSLLLLESLHRRWTRFLRSLDDAHFARAFRHPESGRTTLDVTVQLYAWHGRHHLAHITSLRERRGW